MVNITDNSIIEFFQGHLFISALSEDQEIMETRIRYGNWQRVRAAVGDLAASIIKKVSATILPDYCGGCGNCCKGDVLVTSSEIFNMSLCFGLKIPEFMAEYLDEADSWNPFDRKLKKKDGACVFLKKSRNDERYVCGIYENRPQVCRLHPAGTFLCRRSEEKILERISRIKIAGEKIYVYPQEGPEVMIDYGQSGLEKPMETFKKSLETVDVDTLGKIDAAIRSADEILDILIKDIDVDIGSPKFTERIVQMKGHIADLSDLAADMAAKERIESLWTKLRTLEDWAYKKTPEELSCPGTREETPPRAPLNGEIVNLQLFPEFLNFYVPRDDQFYPVVLYYRLYPDVRNRVRDILTQIAREEDKNVQTYLAETDPECILCGECCKFYTIEIKPSDVERLAENLGIKEEEFREKYATPVKFSWNNGNACLRKITRENDEGSGCVFLEIKNGLYFCQIHGVKPDVCRKYSPRNKLCTGIVNTKYWHRKIRNVILVRIQKEGLELVTHISHSKDLSPLFIEWSENEEIKKKVEDLEEELKYLVKKATAGG